MTIRPVRPTDLRMNAVDYYAPPSDRPLNVWAQQLWDAGVRSVQRYLFEGSKGITRAERAALKARGIAIRYGFEAENSNWRGGKAQGVIDGKRARNLASQLGVPRRAVIYFAVDEDAAGLGMLDVAIAYGKGTNAGFLRRIGRVLRVGSYGGRLYGGVDVVEQNARYGHSGFQTASWSRDDISSRTDLYQHGFRQHIAGVEVDFDWAYNLDGAELPNGSVGAYEKNGGAGR